MSTLLSCAVSLALWMLIAFNIKVGALVFMVGTIATFIIGFFIGEQLTQRAMRTRESQLFEALNCIPDFRSSSKSCDINARALIACNDEEARIALCRFMPDDSIVCDVVEPENILDVALNSREVKLGRDEIKKSGFVTFEVREATKIDYFDIAVFLRKSKWDTFVLSFADRDIANKWLAVVKSCKNCARSVLADVGRAGGGEVATTLLIEKLKALSDLRQSGALSSEEFELIKSRLLP